MRKLIGLCFLTATLLASSANAQSIFIEKGDPSTMSATLGGQYGGLYGGSLNVAYTYRGVFDVGLDASGSRLTSGTRKNLNALNVAPFMNWHIVRSDADELPISITAFVSVEKLLYNNNNGYAPPEGWGVVVGPSVYRRIELGKSMLLIPEALVAYDFMYTRSFSNAHDQNSPWVGDINRDVNAPSPESKHSVRVLVRANLGFKSGSNVFTVTPYGGYLGVLGAVAGLTAGIVL